MKILYNGSPIFLISGSGKPEPAQMQQMLEMWSMQGHSLPFLPTIPDYFSLTLLCLPHFFSLFYAFHLFTPQCRHFSLWEGFLSSEMKYTQDQVKLVWLQTTIIKKYPPQLHCPDIYIRLFYHSQNWMILYQLQQDILQQKSASALPFQIKYTQDRDAGIYECQVIKQIQNMRTI